MVRASLRRFFMGLATIIGLRPRGFFIPYRYADGVSNTGTNSFSMLGQTLERSRSEFSRILSLMDRYADDLVKIGSQPPPSPRWTQDWFPGLDGAAAYSIVRAHKPSMIIEVGSGHSTRFIAQAIQDEGLQTAVIAIDPAPRADLEGLGVNCIRDTVQKVKLGVFHQLACGDVLSIDSSHILMPGTDVDILFNRVIPELPAGVLIHIHDMFLPDGYPDSWKWRGYNEQLAVATMLSSAKPDILWASHFVRTRMSSDIENSVAGRILIPDGALESSIWFKKV